MRDFRDAKAMARALRNALKAKGVETTHSESLELIATWTRSASRVFAEDDGWRAD